ncbi:MAG: hypothetical protein FJ134_05580 [Deltaproteobacteria bacterium]|nr:hypothetical protein [Deltaproteobacteria bacterium]
MTEFMNCCTKPLGGNGNAVPERPQGYTSFNRRRPLLRKLISPNPVSKKIGSTPVKGERRMAKPEVSGISKLLAKREREIVEAWTKAQGEIPALKKGLISDKQLKEESANFFRLLVAATAGEIWRISPRRSMSRSPSSWPTSPAPGPRRVFAVGNRALHPVPEERGAGVFAGGIRRPGGGAAQGQVRFFRSHRETKPDHLRDLCQGQGRGHQGAAEVLAGAVHPGDPGLGGGPDPAAHRHH